MFYSYSRGTLWPFTDGPHGRKAQRGRGESQEGEAGWMWTNPYELNEMP